MTEMDVSGCEYYNSGTYEEEPYCGIDEEHPYTCISDENCYYKQMKRLEAENTKLKEKLEEIKEICDSYARTEDYVICSTFNEFLDKVFNIVIGAEDER